MDKEKVLEVLKERRQHNLNFIEALDKKDFPHGEAYKKLSDSYAALAHAIDAIKQVEEQEKFINEILSYTNLYADFHVWYHIHNIVKRHKEDIQDLLKL